MSDLKMAEINRVTMDGRCGADPELKYTAGGKAICRFSLANSEHYKDAQGARQERATWVDVVTFGNMAEYLGQSLKRGIPVYVEGRLQMDEWQDKSTGQKRRKLQIVASRVCVLCWPDSAATQDPPPANRPSSTEPLPDDDVPF